MPTKRPAQRRNLAVVKPSVAQLTAKWFRLKEKYETQRTTLRVLAAELDDLGEELEEYGLTVERVTVDAQSATRRQRAGRVPRYAPPEESYDNEEDEINEENQKAMAAGLVLQAPIRSGSIVDPAVADLAGNMVGMDNGEAFAGRIMGMIGNIQSGLHSG